MAETPKPPALNMEGFDAQLRKNEIRDDYARELGMSPNELKQIYEKLREEKKLPDNVPYYVNFDPTDPSLDKVVAVIKQVVEQSRKSAAVSPEEGETPAAVVVPVVEEGEQVAENEDGSSAAPATADADSEVVAANKTDGSQVKDMAEPNDAQEATGVTGGPQTGIDANETGAAAAGVDEEASKSWQGVSLQEMVDMINKDMANKGVGDTVKMTSQDVVDAVRQYGEFFSEDAKIEEENRRFSFKDKLTLEQIELLRKTADENKIEESQQTKWVRGKLAENEFNNFVQRQQRGLGRLLGKEGGFLGGVKEWMKKRDWRLSLLTGIIRRRGASFEKRSSGVEKIAAAMDNVTEAAKSLTTYETSLSKFGSVVTRLAEQSGLGISDVNALTKALVEVATDGKLSQESSQKDQLSLVQDLGSKLGRKLEPAELIFIINQFFRNGEGVLGQSLTRLAQIDKKIKTTVAQVLNMDKTQLSSVSTKDLQSSLAEKQQLLAVRLGPKSKQTLREREKTIELKDMDALSIYRRLLDQIPTLIDMGNRMNLQEEAVNDLKAKVSNAAFDEAQRQRIKQTIIGSDEEELGRLKASYQEQATSFKRELKKLGAYLQSRPEDHRVVQFLRKQLTALKDQASRIALEDVASDLTTVLEVPAAAAASPRVDQQPTEAVGGGVGQQVDATPAQASIAGPVDEAPSAAADSSVVTPLKEKPQTDQGDQGQNDKTGKENPGSSVVEESEGREGSPAEQADRIKQWIKDGETEKARLAMKDLLHDPDVMQSLINTLSRSKTSLAIPEDSFPLAIALKDAGLFVQMIVKDQLNKESVDEEQLRTMMENILVQRQGKELSDKQKDRLAEEDGKNKLANIAKATFLLSLQSLDAGKKLNDEMLDALLKHYPQIPWALDVIRE